MTAKIKTRSYKSGRRHPYKPRGVSDRSFKKVYWPYIPVVLAITLLLSLGSTAGALTGIISIPKGRVLAYATSMSRSGLLSATNSARSQNGAAALSINSKLNAAAQNKAEDMAEKNYWSHNTPDGDPPWIFVTAQGYKYQKLGENLAAGFSTESSTINGWMASAPHKANMLDKAFTQVGFGYANNSNYTSAGGGPMTIVVAFYGKPQVQASQTTAKSASPSPPPAAATKPSSTASAAPAKKASPPPAEEKEEQNPVPVPNSEENLVNAAELATQSSRAQIALASLPMAQFGTSLALIGAFSALAIWVSRHALAVRRAVSQGESFAIRHPLLDVGLLIIAALSFLLTQTAGMIQ